MRKLRTVFSAFSLSLSIVIVLVCIFSVTGISRVAIMMFAQSLDERYFAIEFFDARVLSDPEENGEQEFRMMSLPEEAYNTTIYKEKNPQVLSAYQRLVTTTMFRIDDGGTASSVDSDVMSASLSVIDPVFAQDQVHNGYRFDALVQGKVPVILPERMLFPDHRSYESEIYMSTSGEKESYKKTRQRITSAIGKTIRLQDMSSGVTTGTEFIVVGVQPEGGLLHNVFIAGTMTIPLWSLSQQAELQAMFGQDQAQHQIIAEFADKSTRDAFVENSWNQGSIQNDMMIQSFAAPAQTFMQEVEGIIQVVRGAGIGIGTFFAVVSAIMIATTLGKIIADSQKEIAVFRAVGARAADIRKMYFVYAWILSTAGYVIGVSMAMLVCILASLRWGDVIFYQLANQSIYTDISEPLFMFLGISLPSMGIIYVLSVLVGICAAAFPVRRATRIRPIQVLREL